MNVLQIEAVALQIQIKTAIEAIRYAGELLEKTNKVHPSYVDAMIEGYRKIGPYIVIAPGIAIPHARPEKGAIRSGLSILRLANPLPFGHEWNDPVKLVCGLAGVDKTSHLEQLRKISQVLGNKDKLRVILNTEEKEEIVRLFNQT